MFSWIDLFQVANSFLNSFNISIFDRLNSNIFLLNALLDCGTSQNKMGFLYTTTRT